MKKGKIDEVTVFFSKIKFFNIKVLVAPGHTRKFYEHFFQTFANSPLSSEKSSEKFEKTLN